MGKPKRPAAAQPLFGKPKKQKGPQHVPLPDEVGDEAEELELSDEDLQFVNSHQQDLGFLAKLNKKELDRAVSQVKEPASAKDAKQAQRAQQGAAEPNTKGPGSAKGGGAGGVVNGDAGGGEGGLSDSGDEVEDYEKRPRSNTQEDGKSRKPVGLPIKTLEGQVVFQPQQQGAGAGPRNKARTRNLDPEPGNLLPGGLTAPSRLAVAGVTIEDDLEEQLRVERARREEEEREEARRRETQERAAAAREQAAEKRRAAESAGVLAELAAYEDAAQRREAAKRSMAAAAQALLRDPEGRLGEVKHILDLLGDSDLQVRRLAMLTGVAVFKDILPGYRIRPPTEKEAEVVVSKEVKKMREYEQALLRAYQALLKALLEAAQQSQAGRQPIQQGRIAVKCMAALLVSLPHFNYTSDLLAALVPYTAHRDQQMRELACYGIAQLVSGDREGGVTVEAAQLVADLVRRRKCCVPRGVLDCLLGLTFSDIGTAEEFEEAKRKQKGKKKKGGKRGQKDDVAKGFEEAQATASAEVRRGYQSLTLEALFELFFRVLKTCTASGLVAQRDGAPLPSSRFAKRFLLLFPTLEGLSKYAHLISVDYFGDLMAVLQQLLASSALPPAERLRCLLTVSEILRGQGEALTVDRRGFYTQLYSALTHTSLVPLLEEEGEQEQEGGEAGEVHPLGPRQQQQLQQSIGSRPEEQVGPLLCGLLEGMILESKLLDATRQAAFAKRMAATAGAAGDTGAAMGLLCVLHRMLRRQAKLRGMLENEAGGPSGYKTFSPDCEDPAEAGALAVPLWELSLLATHFHPHVAQAARDLAAMATPGGASGGHLLPLGASPAQLAAQYSTATGGFRPAPTPGTVPHHQQRGGKRGAKGHSMQNGVHGVAGAGAADLAAFLTAVQLAGAQDVLLPAAAGPSSGGAGRSEAGPAGEEGVLSLPGWGVGDAAALSDGGTSDGELAPGGEPGQRGAAGIAGALQSHFRLARGFRQNAVLRREAALTQARLAMFQRHLAERQMQEEQKEAERRRKGDEEERQRRREEEEGKARQPEGQQAQRPQQQQQERRQKQAHRQRQQQRRPEREQQHVKPTNGPERVGRPTAPVGGVKRPPASAGPQQGHRAKRPAGN